MTPLLIAFDIGGRSPPVAVCSRLPATASEELGNKKGSGAVCFPQQRILPILLLGIVCLVGSGAAHGFFPTQINTGPSAAGGVSRDTWSPTLRSSDGETLEASTVLRAIARTEGLAEIRSLLTYDWTGATRKEPHFCGKRKNGPPRSKNRLVKVLGEVRDGYGFFARGYVVMPEHIHLFVSEPAKGTPSTIRQVLKQRVSRRLRRETLTPTRQQVVELETLARRTGYSRPHTVDRGSDGVYVSALGSTTQDGPSGIFIMDPESFDVLGNGNLTAALSTWPTISGGTWASIPSTQACRRPWK
jgi:REP element-mobilizing transposase RayT